MSADANQDFQDQNTCCQPGRKIVLAGFGAWSLAQEKAEQIFNRLVERGEIAEKNGRTRLHALMENSRKQSESTVEDLSNYAQSAMERMNIPTRADMDALNKQVSSLSEKIDTLKES